MRFAVRLDRQVVPAGRTSSHLALQRQQTGLIRLEEVPLEAEVGSPGGIRDYTYETAADVLVICPVSTQLARRSSRARLHQTRLIGDDDRLYTGARVEFG